MRAWKTQTSRHCLSSVATSGVGHSCMTVKRRGNIKVHGGSEKRSLVALTRHAFMTDLFASLANLLASFPALLHHAQFLLIPGPTDPWSSHLLPRQPLPSSLVRPLIAKVPNITFGSNPCRVRYFSQELVFFREDLMGKMMRNAVRMGGDNDDVAQGADLRKAVSARVRAITGPRPTAVHAYSLFKRSWTRPIWLLYLSTFALCCGTTTTLYVSTLCRQQ